MASRKSPAGDVTTYTYDNLKRPVKAAYGDASSSSVSWDALDRAASATDERGKLTRFTYDVNGNLKSVTDPLNAATALAYDTDDLLSAMTDPLGKKDSHSYDAMGNMTAYTNAAGEKTSFTYDSLYRVKAAADPSGKGSSFTYDAEGRPATVTDAVSNTARFTVDKLGRRTGAATPLGENYAYTFDALSRLTSDTNPLNEKTAYGYDARGLLTSITLADGAAAAFTRNELGLMSGITDPSGNAWARSYDNMGRLVSKTDPLGQTMSYSYDPRNRVTGITSPAGAVQIGYDAAGNEAQRKYSDATTLSFTYDDDNRVTAGNGVTLGYDAAGRIIASNGLAIGRDDLGRITSITYAPDRKVVYAYDTRGLLARISDWAGATTSFTWDDARRLVFIVRPNGVATQSSYDRNSRLAGIREANGDTVLASIAVQRDGAGKIVSEDRNLPQASNPTPGFLPMTYDAAHQLAGGAVSDGLGRLTNDGLRTYSWNLASELTAYSGADGSASFGYDAFRLRTSRTTADGASQNYVLNYALGLPSVATVQSGGADVRYYVYLPDGSLLYSLEAADNSRHFYHFDEVGSTAFLTDDTGAVTDTYGITPYGETVTPGPNNSTDNPFTFAGRWGVMQEPGTSLYYMRFRYYDSAPARFLSRDPLQSLDPREIDPYQYVAGNPMTLVDPLGLKGQNADNSHPGVVSLAAQGNVHVDNDTLACGCRIKGGRSSGTFTIMNQIHLKEEHQPVAGWEIAWLNLSLLYCPVGAQAEKARVQREWDQASLILKDYHGDVLAAVEAIQSGDDVYRGVIPCPSSRRKPEDSRRKPEDSPPEVTVTPPPYLGPRLEIM